MGPFQAHAQGLGIDLGKLLHLRTFKNNFIFHFGGTCLQHTHEQIFTLNNIKLFPSLCKNCLEFKMHTQPMAFWLKIRHLVSVLFRIQLMARYTVFFDFNIYSLQFFYIYLFVSVNMRVCVHTCTHILLLVTVYMWKSDSNMPFMGTKLRLARLAASPFAH